MACSGGPSGRRNGIKEKQGHRRSLGRGPATATTFGALVVSSVGDRCRQVWSRMIAAAGSCVCCSIVCYVGYRSSSGGPAADKVSDGCDEKSYAEVPDFRWVRKE